MLLINTSRFCDLGQLGMPIGLLLFFRPSTFSTLKLITLCALLQGVKPSSFSPCLLKSRRLLINFLDYLTFLLGNTFLA